MQAYVTADYSSEGIATITLPSAVLKRLAITISEAGEDECTNSNYNVGSSVSWQYNQSEHTRAHC